MKFLVKIILVYTFIAIQSLMPISSELSFLNKASSSMAIAGEVSTLDLTSGTGEEDSQSGEEGGTGAT